LFIVIWFVTWNLRMTFADPNPWTSQEQIAINFLLLILPILFTSNTSLMQLALVAVKVAFLLPNLTKSDCKLCWSRNNFLLTVHAKQAVWSAGVADICITICNSLVWTSQQLSNRLGFVSVHIRWYANLKASQNFKVFYEKNLNSNLFPSNIENICHFMSDYFSISAVYRHYGSLLLCVGFLNVQPLGCTVGTLIFCPNFKKFP
jgi:hypothetical protein